MYQAKYQNCSRKLIDSLHLPQNQTLATYLAERVSAAFELSHYLIRSNWIHLDRRPAILPSNICLCHAIARLHLTSDHIIQ